MQPNESFSVPRRALDVEDYIDILRRHKGWIFGPFLLTLVAAVVGVYVVWPDSYISQSVVKVQPQQIPTSMVPSVTNQEMTDRINSMSQTILSRTVLTTIINTFGLYQKERARMPIEDVIELMRKNIQILPVATVGQAGRQVPAFIVQFSYENRYTAQRVVQDLVSRFIDENTRNQSNRSFQAAQFLKDQVDQAKKELDDVESKLTDFRLANAGHLPDETGANLGQLQALNMNITALDNNISRADQAKLGLETELRIKRDRLAELQKEPVETTTLTQEKSPQVAEADRDVQGWEMQLAQARQHYKDTHPDVQMLQQRLAGAKKRRDELVKEDQVQAAAAKKEFNPRKLVNPQAEKEKRDVEADIQRVQLRLEARSLEIDNYTKDLRQANENVKMYQSKIQSAPVGERQYDDYFRDRDMAKAKYLDMQEKLNKAEVAQDMEGRKQGETLELLDPASLPQNPAEPKRPMIISIGAGLGLILGLVMAGAREMKDSSLKNLKDVRAYTQMAILGSIPLLENDFVVRRRKRMAWLGWTTSSLLAAILIAGSIVYYYVSKV